MRARRTWRWAVLAAALAVAAALGVYAASADEVAPQVTKVGHEITSDVMSNEWD
jgi:hypothetical protein